MSAEYKQQAAQAAMEWLKDDNLVIGVGTGSTVNYLIAELAHIKHRIDACIASSKATETKLREAGIPVVDLNTVNDLPIYIDGADEVNAAGEMIKGGGGALTREKIVASVAHQFICIVDESKVVEKLGEFPIAIEVIPMARSLAAREIVKLGGDPCYRQGFVTDNGNIILDVHNLEPRFDQALEDAFNCIPGVVENGLFVRRKADRVVVSGVSGVNIVRV